MEIADKKEAGESGYTAGDTVILTGLYPSLSTLNSTTSCISYLHIRQLYFR